MKTETRTRESYYDVYVAIDGKEFNDKAECEKYEQSAKAVVNANYKRLIVGTNTEDAFFRFGCGENGVEFVKVTSKEDADAVMQMNFIINDYMAEDQDTHKGAINRMHRLLERAIKEDGILVVGRGWNDDEMFWLVGTRNSMKEEIDNVVNASVSAKEAEEL